MIIVEEKDLRYRIGPSTLPNAGDGLFASVLLPKGDWLEVIGVLVLKDGPADQSTKYARRYKFNGSEKGNANIVPLGYAGLVNHTDDPLQRNVQIEYVPGLAKRSQHAAQIVYRFLRDIQPGEELLGHYGDNLAVQIQDMAQNAGYAQAVDQDWNVFLGWNLYGLRDLCHQLR